MFNPGDRSERNQANKQGVFDQVLTFLAVLQSLELHELLEKQLIHLVFSP